MTGLFLLAAFLAAVSLVGFNAAYGAAVTLLVVVFGFGYPVWLGFAQYRATRRQLAIEGATLVQRNKASRIVATIDRTTPFVARCMNQEADWILYRVTQDQRRMWLAVPSGGDGALIRALGLTWPPPVPFLYL